MWENLLVALSNLPCYFPIQTALHNSDYLTASSIIFVSVFSFISHLVENHKHGMSGFPFLEFSRKVSYILNRLDVLGCFIVIIRFGYLFYSKYDTDLRYLIKGNLLIFLLMSVLFLRISEYDKYNARLKYLYMLTHCIWHISIFLTMNKFLIELIYLDSN